MKNIVHIDFETYSPVDLLKCGVAKYRAHHNFQIVCCCFWYDGQMYVNDDIVLEDLADDPRVLFAAHNAQFEMTVMQEEYNIPASRWRCTAASAAYRALPRSLGEVAEALGLKHQKDAEGKRLMMKLCRPDEDGLKPAPTTDEMDRLIEYCKQDVLAEMELAERIGFLPPEEQNLWELDYTINNRGIQCDMDLVDAATKLKKVLKGRLNDELRAITDGIGPSQTTRLTKWLAPLVQEATGKPLKDLKGETLKKLLAVLPDGTAKKVIQIRKDFSTISLAKFDAVNAYEQAGVVRGQLVYHGCTTGRWSGKGVQFQNLPRGTFDEHTVARDMRVAVQGVKSQDLDLLCDLFPGMRPMEILKNVIRGMVVARDGQMLYVLDFSQIEARVLAWLAGQQEVLDAFIDGKDLYKFTASQIYQKPYESIDKKERFIGKVASLALGYQGGAGAFQSMALNYGVIVDESLAAKVKDDWRARNPRIVKLWWDLEDAMRQAVQSRKVMVVRKRLTVRAEEGFMSVELPNGRKLWYYDPKAQEVERESKDGSTFRKVSTTYMGSDSQKQIKWGRIHMYGGKAAENITQAISRDILVHAIFAIEKLGYETILTVHDEIVAEAPKGRGLADMQKAMESLPSWAEGLPLKAAGFATERYYKG